MWTLLQQSFSLSVFAGHYYLSPMASVLTTLPYQVLEQERHHLKQNPLLDEFQNLVLTVLGDLPVQSTASVSVWSRVARLHRRSVFSGTGLLAQILPSLFCSHLVLLLTCMSANFIHTIHLSSPWLSCCQTASCWHQLSVSLLLLDTKEISASLTLRTLYFHLCVSYCHIPRTCWATQSPACLDSCEEMDWSQLVWPTKCLNLNILWGSILPYVRWPFLETLQWDGWILAFQMIMLSKTYFSTEKDYY